MKYPVAVRRAQLKMKYGFIGDVYSFFRYGPKMLDPNYRTLRAFAKTLKSPE